MTQIIMAKVDLTIPEQQVIGEVLRAFASGRFVSNDLMHTLLGYGIRDIQKLCHLWGESHWSELDDEQIWLVGAVFDTLFAYPHDRWALWYRYVHVSPRNAERIFDKWNYLTVSDDVDQNDC
ncbi:MULTISPECIES: hypothetical protein [Deinococcus]|uniref:Uncharacterized protein n=1 Tax=Deinococcus xianganensis TaxID=1507289 RepID=A0A6I4YB34_9DEIO|nr:MULTISPECIES: hypothetical protein [Deinococcus]MXV19599.1 hypothetical protein [Deinococcus xianganensis]